MSSRAGQLWLILRALAVVVLIASGTVVHASSLAYDAPIIARVSAHAGGVTEVGSVKVGGVRVGFASPTVETPGTSKTPALAVLATNTASGAADDALRALSASERRAVGSLRQQVADHTAKLEAYRANPAAYDNLGILERAPTAEIRQSIIDGRIRHLTNEIKAFQDQIDKLLGGAG